MPIPPPPQLQLKTAHGSSFVYRELPERYIIKYQNIIDRERKENLQKPSSEEEKK